MARKLDGSNKKALQYLQKQKEPVKYTIVAKEIGLAASGGYSAMERLEKWGLIDIVGENEMVITEAGSAVLKSGKLPEKALMMTSNDAEISKVPESDETDEEDEPTITMASLGKTPNQIFMNLGVTAGVKIDTIKLVTTMVWAGGADCFNLDWVWKKMGECALPYDLKYTWVHAWKAYVIQEKPEWVDWEPPSIHQVKAQDEKAQKEAKEEVEEVKDTGPREWLIGSKGPIKVGKGAGLYTMEEAKEMYALDIMKSEAQAAVAAAESGGGREKISDLLTALAPYLTGNKGGEGSQEKVSDIITALAPYLKVEDRETLASVVESKIKEALSGLGGEEKPWYETLPAMVTALTGLAPTIRSLLGIPSQEQFLQMIENRLPTRGDGALQPFQVMGTDGQPMVMDLSSLLEVKKFEREQAREDEKHKSSMEMGASVREFLGKLASAAGKMAKE